MKKIITVITITMLLVLTAVPGFAAYSAGDSLDIDVLANYNNAENVYTAELADGKYTVSANGVTVNVTPAGDTTGLSLMVRVIPTEETEAYAWFTSSTEALGAQAMPYEVYWIDADGNRTEVDGDQVEISLPAGYERPAVCGISTDGNATLLDSQEADGSLVFTADGSGYYALVQTSVPQTDNQDPTETAPTQQDQEQGGSQQGQEQGSSQQGQEQGSDQQSGDVPKTGSEHSLILFWVALSLVSASALAVSVKKKQAE